MVNAEVQCYLDLDAANKSMAEFLRRSVKNNPKNVSIWNDIFIHIIFKKRFEKSGHSI